MKYYKVSCEYYIKADDGEDAERIISEEVAFDSGKFMESHIVIDEVNKEIAEKQGVYNG